MEPSEYEIRKSASHPVVALPVHVEGTLYIQLVVCDDSETFQLFELASRVSVASAQLPNHPTVDAASSTYSKCFPGRQEHCIVDAPNCGSQTRLRRILRYK